MRARDLRESACRPGAGRGRGVCDGGGRRRAGAGAGRRRRAGRPRLLAGSPRPRRRTGRTARERRRPLRPSRRARRRTPRRVCGRRPTTVTAVTRIKEKGQLVVGVDQNTYQWGYRDPATGSCRASTSIWRGRSPRTSWGRTPRSVFKAVPTNQRIPALRKRDGRHGGADDDDQLPRASGRWRSRPRTSRRGSRCWPPSRPPRSRAFDDSLRGKRVCTAAGSTGETALTAQRHGAKVLTVPSQLDCLVRLQLGQADAVVTDSALAAAQAAQDPAVELKGEAVHGRVVRRGDEQGRHGSGARG